VAGRDITEGRRTRSIAVDVGVVASTAIWQNTDISYDVAIGGMPFIYAINDERQYVRQTAPFRKEQFGNQTEPGEQSLTGWWIRSQSSFHDGTGIKFYDPALIPGDSTYQFADSKGINIWTEGQATLLRNTTATHYTTGDLQTSGRPFQAVRSIKWSNTDGVLVWDEYDVDKIAADGTLTHFVDYNAGTDYPVYAICDDGVNTYWITRILDSGVPKTVMYKKALTADSSTSPTEMWKDSSIIVDRAVMEYVKERIVIAINNKIFEIAVNATSLPTAVYTHPDQDIYYTSVTASGPAIYVSGYSGIQSSIIKFTLNTSGVMPTLTTAITAAEMPVGEKIYKIYYYLGYMLIGTSKGLRVSVVSDQDGSINYGPLLIENGQPCYDFAARDKFVWCATGVDGEPGVIRVNLGNEIDTLVFAYANDLYVAGPEGYVTTGCAFAGETDQLVFATNAITRGSVTYKQLTDNVATLTTASAHNLEVGDIIWVEQVDATFDGEYTVTDVPSDTTVSYAKTAANVALTAVSPAGIIREAGTINIEAESELITTGYLTTGFIRYNTLEPKNFKRLLGRGEFEFGSITLETVDKDGTEYDVITYDSSVDPVEVTTSSPAGAQEYIAYKFILYRDGTDNTKGPIFQGYQAKATIATPRQRVIQFPVFCYDIETDRYNAQVGYEGRSLDRILQLEDIEEQGDVVTWQDLTTGESRQVVIEQISFTRATPPDKRFSGYGGVITMLIRTV